MYNIYRESPVDTGMEQHSKTEETKNKKKNTTAKHVSLDCRNSVTFSADHFGHVFPLHICHIVLPYNNTYFLCNAYVIGRQPKVSHSIMCTRDKRELTCFRTACVCVDSHNRWTESERERERGQESASLLWPNYIYYI